MTPRAQREQGWNPWHRMRSRATDDVRAEMKHGVLTVTVPKRPEAQPRKIPLGGGTGGTSTQNKPKA